MARIYTVTRYKGANWFLHICNMGPGLTFTSAEKHQLAHFHSLRLEFKLYLDQRIPLNLNEICPIILGGGWVTKHKIEKKQVCFTLAIRTIALTIFSTIITPIVLKYSTEGMHALTQ